MANLQPIDRLRITTLIDNYMTWLLPDTPVVQRRWWPSGEAPVASHGLSLLIETWRDGESHTVLLDPGYPRQAMRHNWAVLDVDLAQVEAVCCSHGHGDHTEALGDFLAAHPGDIPVVLHPEALDQREKRGKVKIRGREVSRPPLPSEKEMTNLGANVVVTDAPYALTPGLWSTGQVPRVTDFEGRMVDGQWRVDDTWDDQSLVAHLRGKGLVVITGCAHAGVINTILHAQSVTGVTGLYAVLGGFHLPRASRHRLDRTIAQLKAWTPALVAPTHCTGFASQTAFAQEMPGPFVLNAVGSRYTLRA
jgi:7,8-dihydropterin-6-yl-methyl-4-(beta-D-ribofuranosyl)aminobenzene 5'-phosphate synthase